ncbi:hypothetical protein MUDAN_DOGOELCO_03310 [Lactiplantibacillus mudanjiangensis]|nr:hypothetical protein MUDAN_DOGOELCO_03310 [Lactiplantibacillus mudanjiangensis]
MRMPLSNAISGNKKSRTGIGITRTAQINNMSLLTNCIYYKPKPTFLQRVRRWYRANH